MSPNPNYVAGRAFEYARKKHWEKEGYLVMRTAGSHGAFDLIAVKDNSVPFFIQCKRCETPAQMKKLISQFKKAPPLQKSEYYFQIMEVKVHGNSEVHSEFV